MQRSAWWRRLSRLPGRDSSRPLEFGHSRDVGQPVLAASRLSAQSHLVFVGRPPWAAADPLVGSAGSRKRPATGWPGGQPRPRGAAPHCEQCPTMGKLSGIGLSAGFSSLAESAQSRTACPTSSDQGGPNLRNAVVANAGTSAGAAGGGPAPQEKQRLPAENPGFIWLFSGALSGRAKRCVLPAGPQSGFR